MKFGTLVQRTALLASVTFFLALPAVASLSGVVPVEPSGSPLSPTATPEPPSIGAVQGAGCQPFLVTSGSFGTEWPLYHNGSGNLELSWTLPNAALGPFVTLWLDGNTTGGVEQVKTADQYAFISVITSDFDDEPPGYALNPGLHTLWAQMEQNGTICIQGAQFTAWPPLIDVTAENAPFDESPTRTETLTFSQMFKVDEPVTDYYAMHSGRFAIPVLDFWIAFGSTAKAGEDFDGPVTTYPELLPFTFPAHEQTTTVDITILDDRCPELTEYISVQAIYEAQLPWAQIIWMAPEWRFEIRDDDFGRPCVIRIDPELTHHP